MKKLVVTLIGIVVVAILIGGCGVGSEECEEDDFFEKYYSECVTLCEICTEWSEMCGNITYDTELCVMKRWYYDPSNNVCTEGQQRIAELINNKDCENGIAWWCIDFQ